MKYVKINDFSGGLSDSDALGVKGSFAEGVGLDIHSSPGILKVNQALKKESGSTVAGLCKFAVASSNGNSYWFASNGKVYKRTSAGAWSLSRTTAFSDIVGACEFNDYIYYASPDKLGRFGPLSGSASWNDTWKTLDNAAYHPMTVQGLYLLIGNGRKIATVDDSGTFTSQGTPDITLAELPPNYEIRTIINFGIDVLVGTTTSDKYTSARIFRWDVSSPAYISDDDIPEYGLNCFIPADNYVYAQAGQSGQIYQYTGEELIKRKKIKGNYENATMEVLPQSYTSFRGLPLFGVSNVSGNPCPQGVYSLGRRDNNYPLALNLEYVISTGHTSGIEIGAMLTIGNDLLVAWKDGTSYGVDIIDWTKKYSSAYYKTLLIDGGERQLRKDFKNFVFSYNSKPSNTDITAKYYLNGGSVNTLSTNDDNVGYRRWIQKTLTGGFIQLRVDFTTSGNNAPELREIYCDFDYKDTI